MSEFARRLREWREYRKAHVLEDVFPNPCLPRRHGILWFLLQGGKKRAAREALIRQRNEEIFDGLEEILDEKRKEIVARGGETPRKL